MPVYNEEENISQSIESILNQTYKNFELLLLDDRSTDKTYEIIKSEKLQNDLVFESCWLLKIKIFYLRKI